MPSQLQKEKLLLDSLSRNICIFENLFPFSNVYFVDRDCGKIVLK